jgi:hypothetical protein
VRADDVFDRNPDQPPIDRGRDNAPAGAALTAPGSASRHPLRRSQPIPALLIKRPVGEPEKV